MNKYSVIILLATLLACSSKKSDKPLDTVGIGHIAISSDESLQPVIAALESAFENLHTAATIDVKYKPEQEAINLMLKDSARVAIVTRELNAAEKKVFEEQKFRYRSLKVGVDAVALIVGNQIKDTLVTFSKLKKILTGADKSKTIVVDNANSSNMTCLLEKLELNGGDMSKLKIFALKSNKEVIEYVQKNKTAIGVIGVNWISDGEDPASMGFLRSINVLSVSAFEGVTSEEYYKPFEYNLYLKNYPIARDIFMITKEARQGLGTGFINFTAQEKGQLIIQKSGILPATQPLRLYQVNN
jgi:phosphate transport system substrate-binding protein